jgi:hypothetical protein
VFGPSRWVNCNSAGRGATNGLLRYVLDGAGRAQAVLSMGGLGRTYVIGSELDYERLWRQTKIGLIVLFALVIISTLAISMLALPPYLVGFVVAVAAVAVGAWRQYLLRGLALPAERLSWQEGLTLQARGRSPVSLKWPMIGSIALVVLSVILLAINPAANQVVATKGIIFFGFCAVVSIFMLRRAGRRS